MIMVDEKVEELSSYMMADIILGQNCVRISGATLGDLIFSKNCFINIVNLLWK